MASVTHASLTGNVVSTVTVTSADAQSGWTATGDQPRSKVGVMNRTGTAAVYFTTDGTAPTVGGANCYVLPAGAIGELVVVDETAGTGGTVKLISASAQDITVRAVLT